MDCTSRASSTADLSLNRVRRPVPCRLPVTYARGGVSLPDHATTPWQSRPAKAPSGSQRGFGGVIRQDSLVGRLCGPIRQGSLAAWVGRIRWRATMSLGRDTWSSVPARPPTSGRLPEAEATLPASQACPARRIRMAEGTMPGQVPGQRHPEPRQVPTAVQHRPALSRRPVRNSGCGREGTAQQSTGTAMAAARRFG